MVEGWIEIFNLAGCVGVDPLRVLIRQVMGQVGADHDQRFGAAPHRVERFRHGLGSDIADDHRYYHELVKGDLKEGQFDFQRMFLSGASDEKPDSQSRITLPPHLRAYANLGRELVVTGVGAHAEIWDAEAWNAYAEGNEDSYSDMEQEVIPGLF